MPLYLCGVSRMRKYICIKNQLGRYYLQRLSCNRALPIGLIAENGSKVANNVDNAKNKASCKENRKKEFLKNPRLQLVQDHSRNKFCSIWVHYLVKKRELIFLCLTLFLLNQKRLGILTFCKNVLLKFKVFVLH